MPIKFRCTHCQQFLGISRAKAGSVSDCPTCGRTLRVPQLDGSVDPLPQLELNLKDSELARALDAVARIGDARRAAAGDMAEPAVREATARAAPVALAEPQELRPVPLPEPIKIELPLPAEKAGSAAAPVRPAVIDPFDELSRLATQPRAAPAPRSRIELSRWPLPLLAALAGAGVLLFGLGFFAGRASTSGRAERDARQSADTARGAPSAKDESPTLPVAVAANRTPALTGRVSYVSSDGNTRPDAGARIIVVPEQRVGESKLPVVGFRAGAADADRELARASLRSLGGDFAIADEQGEYAVELAAAGQYHVLFLSRYQPRDDAEFLEPSLQQLLSTYFDRPANVIGGVQYQLGTFRFNGDDPSTRDQLFER